MANEPPVPLDGSLVGEDLRSSKSDKLFYVTLKGDELGFVHELPKYKSC